MWRVTYERHHLNQFYKTTTCETPDRWLAILVYWWFSFCYFMAEFPVKQVSIYRYEGAVPYLRGGKSRSENKHRIAKLKWSEKYGNTQKEV